ncbi:MAG: hypothetical protein J1F18_07570 [Lachnospiraceae bacterium]|nr:hypothetical protein [Lachnospiraceae bacterium]
MINKFKLLGTKKNNVISIALVLVLLCSLCGGLMVSFFHRNIEKSDSFVPMQSKTSENVELLRDLPQDFTFDIMADDSINHENLSDYVVVNDSKNMPVPVRVESHENFYTILPPESMYEQGEYYTVELQNAKFQEKNLAMQSRVTFAIGKNDILEVDTKTELGTIADEKIVYVSDDTIELVKEKDREYNIDDILLLPDMEDGLGEVAYKIVKINADNGNIISLGVVRPSLDEVYDKVEIYGEQLPNPEDVSFYSEEAIEEALAKNESVKAIGYAVDVINGNLPSPLAKGFDFDANVDITINLPKKIKIKFKDMKFSPVQFTVDVSIKWELTKYDIEIYLEGEIKSRVENFSNIDSNTNIYSSGTRTITEYSFGVRIEFSKETDFSEEQKRQMLEFLNENNKIQNPLNPDKEYDPAWAIQSLDYYNSEKYKTESKRYKDLIDGKEKTAINEEAIINNFIRGKSSGSSNIGSYMRGTEEARKQVKTYLNELVNCYQAGKTDNTPENKSKLGSARMDSQLLPLVSIAIPLPYGCSIHIRFGVEIAVDFKAVFEGKLKVKQTKEQVNVTTEAGSENYENNTTTFSAVVTLSGSFEVRVGAAIETKFTLAKVFYVSLKIEGGGYLETKGLGAFVFGDIECADMFASEKTDGKQIGGVKELFGKGACAGHISLDMGFYFKVEIRAGLVIDLKIIKIDISASVSYDIKKSLFSDKKKETETGVENPELYSELIFEDQLKGKFKNEIAAGEVFKDDMEFNEEFIEFYGDNSDAAITMNYNEYFAKVPQVLRRTINLVTREVTYEPIPFERLHYDLDEGTRIDSAGTIMQYDRSNPVIDDLVWITAEDKYGNLYSMDEFANLCITKEAVPVEKIEINVQSKDIYPDSETYIYADIIPDYASYKTLRYEVVEVNHLGMSIKDETLAYFAYFDETFDGTRGKLITTDKLSIGDTVIVRCTAIHDNVDSPTLALTVVRRPVERISLITQNRQTTVVVGQELPIEVLVYPLNATYVLEGGNPTITTEDPDLATVVEVEGQLVLKVSDNPDAFGKAIGINIHVNDDGNIVELNYAMMIIQVPIDRLLVTDENLIELSNRTILNQGQEFNLVAVAEPFDATVLNRIQILKSVGNEYVTINQNGMLQVANNAPIGYEFTVSAKYDNVNSKNYHFVVEKIATTSVRLFEKENNYDVAPNQQVLLRTAIEPINATYFTPKFIIESGSEWASVTYTGLLTIQENAPIGARIRVYAIVDDVISNTVEFKISPVKIDVISPKSELKVGEAVVLGYDVAPTNNILSPITYWIEEGEEYATLTPGGILTINNNVNVPHALVGVVAEIEGVCSPVFYINIKVPVSSVELYTTMSSGNVELGGSILLYTTIYPEFASCQDVEFNVDNEDLATIKDGWLTVTDDKNAIDNIVNVTASVDGVISNILQIRISKVAVLAVEFSENDLECNVNIGGSRKLYATTIPGNATYNHVSYRIVSGMEHGTIEGDVLTVNSEAPLGSRIEIIASADGVDSDESLVVIVKKIDVERVDIAVEDNITAIAPMGIAKFSASIYPANATESIITYSLIGEGRNIAIIDTVSGELTVGPEQLVTRGDMVIQVVAIADGVSSEPICLRVIVPVTYITMVSTDITAERGNDVRLLAETNYNATNKDVEYHFWDGANITDSNPYGTIDGDILHIKENILIPNAEFMVVAIPCGAESTEIVSNPCFVRVNIPVESVSLMSNKTSIILGESAILNTTIFPVFASNRTIKYKFVDNSGNVIVEPWGITLVENTVNVLDDTAVLTSTPRFMICAFVGGIASNIWRFDVVERPVTVLSFDVDSLQELYCSDTNTYEVHPVFDYGFIIKAAVNSDASFKGIAFSVPTGSANIVSINNVDNQRFDGLYYCVHLKINKDAIVGEVITILAQSQRNPQIRAELKFTITGNYADEIVGANISANNTTILDGAEFGGNMNGFTSNYVNPGDTVRIEKLYFDDELTNKYHKQVTYEDRFSVIYDDERFISPFDKGFTVLDLDKILHYLKPDNDHFTVTVVFNQENGQTLTKEFKFYIFVGVRTVQYKEGFDANGKSFKMTNDEQLYVDRNCGTDKNSFTFRFTINNGTFTTNKLLLVNNITQSDISQNQFTDTIAVESGDYLAGKRLPQLTFTADLENGYNEINVVFMDWYNVGTVFKIVLLNPDHAAVVRELFSFTIHIKPVNVSEDFSFGRDGKFNINDGIVEQTGSKLEQSYQVIYQEGPTPIGGISTYADLRIGYSVKLELGTQRNDLGQMWVLNQKESSYSELYLQGSSNRQHYSGFTITANDKAQDSYYSGKLEKLVFDYIDGAQLLKSVVYIRIVKLLELEASSLRDEPKGNHPRDLEWDLSKGVIFGYSNDKPSTYLVPNYHLISKGNAYIKNGSILVITNPNDYDFGEISYDYKQFYNGVAFNVKDENSHSLERRFIANKEQLLNMTEKFTSDTYGEIRLIADINLSGENNRVIGTLNFYFNGNGHTISNLKYTIGSEKLKNESNNGLFKTITSKGSVKNLNINNVTVKSDIKHKGSFYNFGTLAYENNGLIENVQIMGNCNIDIERQGSIVGGIVSINKGKICNSVNNASIRGSGDIGGIVGRNEGTISGCKNYGNIKIVYHAHRSIGGILGYNYGSGNVNGCSNYGHISSENTITGYVNVGAIIGHNAADFDGKGAIGSFYVTYTTYDGFIFGWGAYDNGTYLFAYRSYRVGKDDKSF